jgi:hypothetical protein
MIISNQVAAAKELCNASKEKHSLLKSLVVTAITDNGTNKGDESFNPKCKSLYSFLIQWLNAPQYIAELESVMSHQEIVTVLESIKSNVENHPKIAEKLSAKTIATTASRLKNLLEEFKQNATCRLFLAELVSERIRQRNLNK